MEKNYLDASLTKFHRKLYLCIILGQIACGYALSIAGMAVTEAQDALGLNALWVGLLGAGTLIGLAGSLIVGNISDKIGRSKLLLLDMTLFTIFSVLQFFTSNIYLLLLLRIGLGLCIAVDYVAGASIISEWFPKKEGHIFLGRFYIFWTFGYVASFCAGLIMSRLQVDFHYIFMSSVVPGALAMVARFLLGMPESPAWLASRGEVEKANELVKKHIGNDYIVIPQQQAAKEEKVSVAELFTPKYRKNTLVGGIFYATQVFTYFGVGIFLPILVKELQIGNASTSSIIYMVFVLAGAFLGTYLCNRMARRRFLISTYYIAAASLIVMIVSQEKTIIITGIAFAVFALVMSIAVVIENPYPPELFDDRVRGTGVGVVVAFSRVGAAAGTFLMPTLVQNIGVYGTLAVCMATLLIGGVVCHLWAPETSINHVHENSKHSPQENVKKELA